MSELDIYSGLDQPTPTLATARQTMLEQVDEIMLDAKSRGGLAGATAALNAANQLISIQKVSGLGLAKLLYELNHDWTYFEVDAEFSDFAFETLGIAKITIGRYIGVWEKFAEESMPLELMDRPIKDQVAISKMLEQGYEPDEEQWEHLINAPDNNTVLANIREIKGVEPRAFSLILRLARNGDLKALKGGDTYHIGWLNVMDDDPVVQKAINRLITAGVIRE